MLFFVPSDLSRSSDSTADCAMSGVELARNFWKHII
jgi:hypothetical protein